MKGFFGLFIFVLVCFLAKHFVTLDLISATKVLSLFPNVVIILKC